MLFGSRARGDAGQRSDIDLAIEAPTMSRAEWQRVIEIVEDAPTLLEIDVVRLERASNRLRTVISAEGKVLYLRSDLHP